MDVEVQLVGVPAVPLNLTVLLPSVEPKFEPEIVTEVPVVPDVGERLVMLGAETTVKVLPLLETPETFTTTLPVVAPLGTTTTMLAELQLVYVATVAVLNLTVLVPRVEPKPLPVIVTDAPTAPEVGERLAILGAAKALTDARSTAKAMSARDARQFQIEGSIASSLQAKIEN